MGLGRNKELWGKKTWIEASKMVHLEQTKHKWGNIGKETSTAFIMGDINQTGKDALDVCAVHQRDYFREVL